MKLSKLCKIEGYRFFHSMEIVKYYGLVPVLLFLLCYIHIFPVRDNISTSAVWGSVSSAYIYLVATVCTLTAIYVGREFHYRTIYYEITGGYDVCKIAIAKTVTSGVILSVTYTLCMFVFLMISSDCFTKELFIRVVLLFVIHLHIVSSSVLYVMLCKNGILGGVIAFVRFYLGEALLQSLLAIFKAKEVESYLARLQVCTQWFELIHLESAIHMVSVILILTLTFAEYGILLLLLRWMRKRFDFA